MSIGRICQREVDLADPDETAQAAGQRMGARAVGSLVVVNQKRQPVGIVTDRDLAVQVVGRGHDPREIRVRDLMSSELETVRDDTPVERALALMRMHGVRRLPVVGWNGQLIGLVSFDDILALLAEEMAQMGALLEKTSPRRLAEE